MAIDFKNVDVKAVLEYYSIRNIREIGDEIMFSCPSPEHKRGDRNPSASINKLNGKWHCFGCGRKGSIVSFISDYEKIPYSLAQRWLREAYGGGFKHGTKSSFVDELKKLTAEKTYEEEECNIQEYCVDLFEVDWEEVYDSYKQDQAPKILGYLFKRGFSPETLNRFEIGYDTISSRISIPYRDRQNNLVGFKGRSTNNVDKPKYITLGDGSNNRYGFKRFKGSNYVFGIHNCSSELIICEGELDCIWLRQQGFEGSVSLGGCDPSEKQIRQIKAKADRVTIFLDGDKAGEKGSNKLLKAILPSIPATIVQVPKNTDPQEMSRDQIEQALKNTINTLIRRK